MRCVVKPVFHFRWLPALAACALLAMAAPAEAAKTLRWRFVAGETNKYVLEQDMVSEQTSEGRSMKTTVKQTMDMTWRVKAVDDQGVAEVTQTVDRVRMNVKRPPEAGSPLAFDSAGKNATDPETRQLAAHFQSLVKHPFVMKIDPLGGISDVELPETVKAALKGSAPGPGGEEAFKEMFAANTVPFPSKPVDKGSIWKHAAESKAPLGKQKAITTYTYEGMEKLDGLELDKIGVQLNVQLDDDGEAKLKPRIVSQESEGVIYFDGRHGWLAKQHTTSKLDTELTQGDMTLAETVTTTIRIKLVSPPKGETPD